ncbi:MAG: branched-chain amino acid ABC transporter substrate-binding protein [Methylobacteriaceae bacterium]|nr:branched-chain amino acid ABC transporter substrate-binding protein [Methylobacteriaceae bacterium]MBV9244186.1 branched-chain amino acid ABC transporter substrate-binding protein [Methylobacteriaceae bacterium]MBV9633170.1 branched-chain amino acid ABC transporter substrate-binding protein [Methylobacteriaceae bacterium]MBV9704267.1 branched-chain amino acid ABC transporter substrate-binding protein [Methylobacteriaceae bacterium]
MLHATRIVLVAALALGAAAGAARADIKIGVAGPITGPNAAFGAQLKFGAEQAAEDINAAGGILGQKIAVEVGDDASDPKQGVSVANKFVGDGIKLVVGHFNSGVTIPASEVYADNGVLDITPAATNPKVTDRGLWNMFRTCGRDDQQGLVASAFIVKNFKGKNVAVLHDKTTYGKGLADETKKGINAAGIKEALYEGVNVGEKDFSALVSKIKEAKVDLVYWGGLHTELGLIVRQMRDQGMTTKVMGADGIVSEEFVAIGGPGVEGTFMTFPPDPRKRPTAAKVVKEFTDKGFDPEAYTLYSYAAVEVIKQAAEKANSLDPKTLAGTIKSGMTFHTVLGDMTYDQKGDRTNIDYVLYTWKKVGDKITYVQNEGE